jgi:GTP-binding protein HflX
VVFNKADLVDGGVGMQLRGLQPDALFVSAKTGEGIDLLMARIDELLPHPSVPAHIMVPFDRGDVVARLHDVAVIKETSYTEQGTQMRVLVEPAMLDELQEFALPN